MIPRHDLLGVDAYWSSHWVFLLGNERMAYDQKEMGCLDSNWWVLLLPDV
jgi:hypothetical protein